MMNQNNTGQYTLGRGRWLFDLFKPGTNTGTGERYLGNTPEASLAVSSEKLDHFFADSGIREKDLTVLLETSRSGSFTTDVISPENLAMYFMGDVSKLTNLGLTGHREAITSWARGRQFQIGNSDATPTGMRNLNNFKLYKAASATVVDLTQPLAGQVGVDEVAMSGNYEIDLELGRLMQALFDRHFPLPQLPADIDVFALAMELGDRVYARSVQLHGEITPRLAEAGMRVFDAYLGLYLPAALPKREKPLS